MKYHLSIDIGASSGRHILGYICNGKIFTEEIYRFENNLKSTNSGLIWDIEALVENVFVGIKKCAEIKKIPETIAIDTWGVDYVLFDNDGNEILPVYCYRDSRCVHGAEEVERIISRDYLYERTGIQKQNFNTIYQFMCDKVAGRLEKASRFLMIPDYIAYRLTGVFVNEYTNASTTGLINAKTKSWDFEIIEKLGYPKNLFVNLSQPCERIGTFTNEVKNFIGFDSTVITCPTHDTASAVAASPIEDKNSLYISSGTWSLIGMEIDKPILSRDAMESNFTNEGGILGTVRFLKNYMGMWLFQNIRRNLNKIMTYDEMMYLAQSAKTFEFINVNAPQFTAPDDMICEIRKYLNAPDLELSVVLNSVYHSLAKSYATAVNEIEKISGETVSSIHIVGGGCMDKYLNMLTSKYTGKPVTAGPSEATSLGNLISQFIYSGECKDLNDARKLIIDSFKIAEVKNEQI